MELAEVRSKLTLEYFSLKLLFAINVRRYQLEGSIFMLTRERTLLGDDRGLGKTLQGLTAWRIADPDFTLIVCSKNALATWRKEFQKWLPDMAAPVIITGQKSQRMKAWKLAREHGIGAITSQSLRIDSPDIVGLGEWDCIIGDEVHKFLRNRKTTTYKAFKQFAMKTKLLWLMSGTPSSRGPRDMWAMISLLRPKLFPSYWKFLHTFHEVEEGPWGKEVIGTRNMDNFQKLTGPFILQRMKKDVQSQLPPKLRTIEPLDMTAEQKRLFDQLSQHMIAKTDNELIITSTVLAKITKLRQLLVCPKSWDESLGYGAILEYIKEHFIDNELQKGVIFTPFPSLFPYLEQFLKEEMEFQCIPKLRGGMTPDEQDAQTNMYAQAPRAMGLVSIKYAESFEMTSGQIGYFCGYEYDPQQNYQAEDRMHRLISSHAVQMMYFKHSNCWLDDASLDIVDNKVRDCRHLFRNPEHFRKILVGL